MKNKNSITDLPIDDSINTVITDVYRFHGTIETQTSNVIIFLNSSKTQYLPILLDYPRMNIINGFQKKLWGVDSCGIYSLLYFAIYKMRLLVHSVFLGFSKKGGLPLVSLIVVDKKNKIHPLSQFLVLPEDAAVCAVIYNVPIVTNGEMANNLLTFPIGEVKEENLVQTLKDKILSIEKVLQDNLNIGV